MSNLLWVKTKKREELLTKARESPEGGKLNTSMLLEVALQEWVQKHAKSKNNQTTMSMFEKDGVMAVPNLYEAIDNPKMWEKFFNSIKSKKDYKLIDNCIMNILTLHNKADKRLNL